MSAVEAILSVGDELAAERAAFVQEKADHARTVAELGHWRGQAAVLEGELRETVRLLADVRERNVELEVMYAREVAAAAWARSEAASARAAAEALRGNR